MPAMCAIQKNELLSAFYHRLVTSGKVNILIAIWYYTALKLNYAVASKNSFKNFCNILLHFAGKRQLILKQIVYIIKQKFICQI